MKTPAGVPERGGVRSDSGLLHPCTLLWTKAASETLVQQGG
jgi:hypothetical protein